MLNRSRQEVVADILHVAKDGVCKTRVMYRCNLSWSMTNRYLKLLGEKGLLSCNPHFKTTEKGFKLLRVLMEAEMLWIEPR